ncbi:unnamed protein product [Pylaiella littoralis]
MDTSGAAFANQLMYFNNPRIQAYDDREFMDPQGFGSSPISHQVSMESYKPVDERRTNIAGFSLDRTRSDERHAIYHHKADKRVVIGLRGTVPSLLHPRDIKTDIALTLGQFKRTRHYKEAVQKFKEVHGHYGDNQHYHTAAHSLGAHTSLALALRFPKSIKSSVGFNTPGSLFSPLSTTIQKNIGQTRTQKKVFGTKKQKGTHIDYWNSLDPVGFFAATHRKGHFQKEHHSLNPHSLEAWLNHY